MELLIHWAALVAYVLAGSLAIFSVVLRRKPERTVLALLVLGVVLHTTYIALRWGMLDRGPYITMFEGLSSGIWNLMLVYTLVYWRIPAIRPATAVVMPVIFMMMGWMMMFPPGEIGHKPQVYHTIWLYIHIGFAKIFISMVFVAVGISGIILLRSMRFGAARFANMPDDSRLDELSFRFMALALIFETLMLITGAIWAQDAWGRYWDWDPLETWAFLTWLLVIFTLHFRNTYKTSPRVFAIMVIAVFCMAFFVFFGTPFVSTMFHQGVGGS